MIITDKQREIIRKTIYAVETGGHIYGNQEYDCFIESGTNTAKETAITIGAGQWHAENAQKLLKLIREADPVLFKELDTAGISKDVDKSNWSSYKLSKGSAKAKCIQKLIDTEAGHKIQDQLLDEELEGYMIEAQNLGVTSLSAQAMCANFTHHGGSGATNRIVSRAKSKFNSTTLDSLYKSCQMDTEPNQVGTYKDRQLCVYTNLKERLEPIEDETTTNTVVNTQKQETVTEKEETKVTIEEETKQVTATVVVSDVNKTKVITAQKKMNKLFNLKVRVDGVWDSTCRTAYIKSVQTALNKSYSEGLKVDGDFGPKTLAAVKRHSLRKGMKNSYVKVLQIGLYAHGISLIGGIDGEFGDSTYRGVKAFQSKMSIDVDGIAGKDTITNLIKK